MANVLFPFPSVDFSASSSDREAQLDNARRWATDSGFPGFDIFVDACDIIEVRLNGGSSAASLELVFNTMLFTLTTYHAGVVKPGELEDELLDLASDLVA